MEILESALRHLKLENAQLKGDMVKSTLDSLTPLNIPPVYNELKANPEERKDKLSEASANLSKLVTVSESY